jgi:hypothetical protein
VRWPFDADLAVAALNWTTVDVPLLHWQLKFLHHSTPFPGLRSKELWYSSVLKSSSSKECSSFSSCASRTSPTAVAIIHSITEKAHSRKPSWILHTPSREGGYKLFKLEIQEVQLG